MHKKIASITLLLTLTKVESAGLQKRIFIDEHSPARTICQLEFAPIKGLLVEAKLAPSAYHSRVNNERYAPCPYDIEMKYGGSVMRVDFGSSFDLESVKDYRHSMPVDSGFFVYGGQEWKGESDTLPNANANIKVTEIDGLTTIMGFVGRSDPNSRRRDYCYAVTSKSTPGRTIFFYLVRSSVGMPLHQRKRPRNCLGLFNNPAQSCASLDAIVPPNCYGVVRISHIVVDSVTMGAGGLLVEAFTADHSVQGIGPRDVIVLSTNASVELAPLLGKSAAPAVSLADGSRRYHRPSC